MANIAWDDYLPEVISEVDGVPYKMAINEIRNSAIQLCEKSEIWRKNLDPLDIAVGEGEYLLDIPSDAEVITLRWATHNGVTITPTSEDELDTDWNNTRSENWRVKTGDPTGIFMLDPYTARVVPLPVTALASGLLVGVSLKPAEDSYEGPQLLYTHWKEAIAYGAKWKLLSMKTRPWFDSNSASSDRTMFFRKIGEAKIRARKSSSRTTTHVRMRPMA